MKSPSALALTALLALALPACKSADNGGYKPMSDSMESRLTRPDMNKRSGFESSITSDRSGMGSYMQKQGFKTRDYNGTSAFRRPKTIEQNSYNQAKPNTQFGDKTFTNREGTNRDATRTFATSSAREGDQSARQGSQTFREGSDVFATSAQRDAAKALERNDQPLIIESQQEEFNKATNYSENDIRRMLNRK